MVLTAIQAPAVTGSALYDAVVEHVRREPLDNRFRYRIRLWLIDLADPPLLPVGLRWLRRFDARDHLGDPHRPLRENLERFLSAHGVDLRGGRVLMLAGTRGLGHAFNPLTVHWCYDADGALAAVIAEVHNTYGDRHAYLLAPDPATGLVDAVVDKQMYVSPFFAVAGEYRIRVTPPAERLSVTVTLQQPGQQPFVATMRGARRPRRPVRDLWLGASTSWRMSGLIRRQGIGLWRRGLRVEPRPAHPRQEAV